MKQVELKSLPLSAINGGSFTIESAKSGEHRTFRVDKAGDDDNPVSFVSMLVGPDNEQDYQSFALLNESGSLFAFRKYRDDSRYVKLVRMLRNLDAHLEAEHVRLYHENSCLLCGRKLTTPESVETGIGPVCRRVLASAR
jgi:hypothetical protein